MRVSWLALATLIISGALLLQGCNACSTRPSNPEQVRQATADATAEVKNNAKAVAEGVRDGLHRPANNKSLNLNTASRDQIAGLPGISGSTASRIVANRPYRNTHDLLDQQLVSREEYDRIASQITVE
jgi:DNA uptake protein ComE-like DNA-binding protein